MHLEAACMVWRLSDNRDLKPRRWEGHMIRAENTDDSIWDVDVIQQKANTVAASNIESGPFTDGVT
jgi:hypothetical protein